MKKNLHRMLVAFAAVSASLSANAQEDCTSKIQNPNFEAADKTPVGWTFETLKTFSGANAAVKASGNRVFTAYSTSFDCHQTIEGLAPGRYKLSVQAFARPIEDAGAIWTSYKKGETVEHDNVFYGNGTEKKVMLICEDYCSTLSGGTQLESGKLVPNSSGTTSAAFSQTPMHYDQSLVCEVGEDGKLTIGIKATGRDGSYYGFDNFRLYGPMTVVPEADVTAILATVPAGAMNAAVKTALETAVKALEAEASFDNYDAVVAAIDAAKTSVAVYSKVAAAIEKGKARAAELDVTIDLSAVESAMANGTITDGAKEIATAMGAAVQAKMADVADGADITFLLKNTTFNNTLDGWDLANVVGDLQSKNNIVRAFNASYDASQTIYGLPAGIYKVNAQIFGRAESNNSCVTKMKNGESQLDTKVVLYANGESVKAPHITSESRAEKGTGNWTELPDGSWIPDNGASIEQSFNEGLYQEALTAYVGEDGVLKIGIKQEVTGDGRYSGFDNIRLTLVKKGGNNLAPAKVSVKAAYATFVAPFEVELPAGVTAYTIDGVENGLLTLTAVEGNIAANTPVVLSATAPVTDILYGTAQEAANLTQGLLTGVLSDTQIQDGYVLQKHNGKVAFYAVEAAKTVPANRAYIKGGDDLSVKALYFADNATAIETLETLTSGKAQIYDLNGRQLQKLQKGINIVNGVKILVK